LRDVIIESGKHYGAGRVAAIRTRENGGSNSVTSNASTVMVVAITPEDERELRISFPWREIREIKTLG
jgi:hypothetical protein